MLIIFLTNGIDEFAKIYRFYKPKNLRCDSLLEREACANYLKQIQILDVRKYMDKKILSLGILIKLKINMLLKEVFYINNTLKYFFELLIVFN